MDDGLLLEDCLNPYCSGRWSRTWALLNYQRSSLVLILIVVEDGLVLVSVNEFRALAELVLILIVVEDGLVRNWKSH